MSYSVDDITTHVYEKVVLSEHNCTPTEDYSSYVYSYDPTTDFRIDNGSIIPLRAGSSHDIKVTNPRGESDTFTLTIENRPYQSGHSAAEASEGWFDDVNVTSIGAKPTSFGNGMDISSCSYLYDNGARYYNEDGNEESLFLILKEHDVDFVRLRLWVDPNNHDTLNNRSWTYGGGDCSLTRVKWMAKEAKAAGLKYLLDFHYSDFWADPSHQVIPKAWADITTVEAMAAKIKSYTASVLDELNEEKALPDYVAIGNENTRGLLCDVPGKNDSSKKGDSGPTYISGSTASSIGGFFRSGGDNSIIHTYLSNAIAGVKEKYDIPVMLHYAKGLTALDNIKSFFDMANDLDYDIVGISGCIYWHFQNINALHMALTDLSAAYPSKKIAIAETAYGFTYESDDNLAAQYSKSGTAKPVSGYQTSTQGQANCLRDITNEVASLKNGFGVCYWEGAWTIKAKCGWADSASKNSWANQAFFSYDGKVLGSLSVYQKMWK